MFLCREAIIFRIQFYVIIKENKERDFVKEVRHAVRVLAFRDDQVLCLRYEHRPKINKS